jgi:hypothetical protein
LVGPRVPGPVRRCGEPAAAASDGVEFVEIYVGTPHSETHFEL